MFNEESVSNLTVQLAYGTLATLTLWAVSAILSIALALILVYAVANPRPMVRWCGLVVVNLTRGIPTSVLVIAAGMLAMRMGAFIPVPSIFTGTIGGFQHIAWAIVAALAFGSAGHLAMIFHAAYCALGQARRDQLAILGCRPWQKAVIVLREVMTVVLPSTGARLIHHLHNTAFASLFPVTELFGLIRGQSDATAKVFLFTSIGCLVYAVLSFVIWLLFRGLEAFFAPPQRAVQIVPGQTSLQTS